MKRPFVAMLLALILGAVPGLAAEIGEDGLHKQDWFSVTFKDIGEDIETAAEDGKRLVLVFEQRGCIYCQRMHEELLSDPEVADFIRANFSVVQFNLFGDEEVTDLDGEVLTEKTAARKWGVVFTPTILFMPDTVSDGTSAAQASVAKMPGAFGKWTFLNMFRWVDDKAYEGDEHFQKYHARIIEELRKSGRLGAE